MNFAYGSNMLLARIRQRVPSVRFIGVAVLRNHQLCWHKPSTDGSGKCDVVASGTAGAVVYGVLYEIARSEKRVLDEAEGLVAGYAEKQVQVELNGAEVVATIYYATSINRSLKPYSWYKALVVAGAQEHGLPDQYVAGLDAVPAANDSNAIRHAKNMALANAR